MANSDNLQLKSKAFFFLNYPDRKFSIGQRIFVFYQICLLKTLRF